LYVCGIYIYIYKCVEFLSCIKVPFLLQFCFLPGSRLSHDDQAWKEICNSLLDYSFRLKKFRRRNLGSGEISCRIPMENSNISYIQ